MHACSSSSPVLKLVCFAFSSYCEEVDMCSCKVESVLCVVVSTMTSSTRQQDLCIDWLDDHLFASAPKYSTSRRLSRRYLINQTCGATRTIEVHTSCHIMLQKSRTKAMCSVLFLQRLKLVVLTVT